MLFLSGHRRSRITKFLVVYHGLAVALSLARVSSNENKNSDFNMKQKREKEMISGNKRKGTNDQFTLDLQSVPPSSLVTDS